MARRPSSKTLKAFGSALRGALGADRIHSDVDTLALHSKDWSVAEPVLPDYVVHPENTDEVAAVLRLAHEFGVPVTPRGLGSGKVGGAIPIHGGLVLSTARLDRIERIDRDDMTAEVGAGVVLRDLWAAVEDENLFYPPDPNSSDLCSIGGNIACNAGGPRALKYGVTRDYVMALEVVLANGQILDVGKRTRKHVTGYDLCGLIVGSEGTLGVVTKAVLRLLPEPGSVQTAVLMFKDVKTAAQALTKLLAEGHEPRTLELLDHHALAAVARKRPGTFSEEAGALLIAETDGKDEAQAFAALERLAQRSLEEGAIEVKVATSESDRRRMWGPRNTLSESLRATAEAKISEDIVVPRSAIPAMIRSAEQISLRHRVRVATYGHAGDGNLHVNVLFDESDRHRANLAVEEVMASAVEFGGTLSGEHGLGITKRDFLPLEHPNHKIELQRAIKQTLDPRGILNPGKVFPDPRSTHDE